MLDNIFSHRAIEAIGWTLLHFIWQGAVIAVLLATAHRLLHKASANTRYVAACLAMIMFIVSAAATMYIAAPAKVNMPVHTEIAEPASESPAAAVVEEIPEPSKAVTAKPAKVATEAPSVSWKERIAASAKKLLPHIVFFWILGVLLLSVWHLGGWAQLQRLRLRMIKPVSDAVQANTKRLAELIGVHRVVELTESALIQVPTVIGWLKPVILLPASVLTGLSGEQLEAILAHELAHIKRYDYLVNMFQIVIEIVGFYHPAVWWVSHRIRAERENCCDDIAVRVTGDGVGYAKALTAIEELRGGGHRLAVAASGGSLLDRVRRLLGGDSQQQNNSARAPALIAVLLVLAAIIVPATVALSSKAGSVPDVQVEGEEGWGEEVNGLQLGLGFDSQERPYRQGEVVSFKVYVRNTGDKIIKLVHFGLRGWTPTILDSHGKTVLIVGGIINSPAQIRTLSLSQGETKPVGTVFLKIDSEPGMKLDSKDSDPHCYLKPGVYRVSQKYRFDGIPEANWHGTVRTGEIKLTIVPGELEAATDAEVEGEFDGLFPQAPYELQYTQTVVADERNILLELHNKKEGYGEIPSSIVMVRSGNREIALKIDRYTPLQKITYKILKTYPAILCIQNPNGGNCSNCRPWYIISLDKETFLKNLGKVSHVRDLDKDGINDLLWSEDIWEGGLGWFCHAEAPGAWIYYKIENGKLVPDTIKNVEYWNNEIRELDEQINILSREILKDAIANVVQLKLGYFHISLLRAILQKFLRFRLLGDIEKGWQELQRDLRYHNNEYFFFSFTDLKSDNTDVKTGKFPIQKIEETIRKSLEQAAQPQAPAVQVKEMKRQLEKQVSVDFRDLPIDDVVRIIAEEANVYIFTSQKLKGRVTSTYSDVPVSRVLSEILSAKGYGYVVDENLVRITPLKEISRDSYGSSETLEADLGRVKEALYRVQVKPLSGNDEAGRGIYRWDLALPRALGIDHGWFSLSGGEMKEHVGAGLAFYEDTKLEELSLKTEIENDYLLLTVKRDYKYMQGNKKTAELKSKTAIPKGTVLKTERLSRYRKISNKEYSPFWIGRFVKQGKTIKTVVYCVRVAIPDDEVRHFSPEPDGIDPEAQRGVPKMRILFGSRAKSEYKLRLLAQCLHKYASTHDALLPQNQEGLEEYFENKADFKWILENVEYVAKGASVNQRKGGKIVVAYDKTLLNKGKGTNVLFLDYSVRFVLKNELVELGIVDIVSKPEAAFN